MQINAAIWDPTQRHKRQVPTDEALVDGGELRLVVVDVDVDILELPDPRRRDRPASFRATERRADWHFAGGRSSSKPRHLPSVSGSHHRRTGLNAPWS